MNYRLKISIFLSVLALFGASGAYAANPTIVRFIVTPQYINAGDPVTITWATENASSCTLFGGRYANGAGFSETRKDNPTQTTTYTLTCDFAQKNSVTDSQTVYVNGSTAPVYPTPTPTPTPFPTYVTQPPPQTQLMNTACATSPASPKIGDTVTFAAAASGGIAPYIFTWSGSVSGSGQTVNTAFSTTGTKNATVIAVDSSGRSAQSSCSVNVISGASTPTPTPTPTTSAPKPTPATNGEGKVEGATTVCKQVTVCFDTSTGKTVETSGTPPVENSSSPSPTPTPAVSKNNNQKSSATSFLATIFNVKGDVWGKIKSLVIWYLVILLIIVLIIFSYMGIKRIKSKKELAATQLQNQQKPKL